MFCPSTFMPSTTQWGVHVRVSLRNFIFGGGGGGGGGEVRSSRITWHKATAKYLGGKLGQFGGGGEIELFGGGGSFPCMRPTPHPSSLLR